MPCARHGSHHLGTDQGSAFTPGIDADQAGVFSDNASATLIAIVDASDRNIVLETRKTRAHNSELRIGEDNGQRGSARLGLDRGPGSRVDPGDAAFIGGLVQQRTIPVDITGDEDRAISALHRLGSKRGAPRSSNESPALSRSSRPRLGGRPVADRIHWKLSSPSPPLLRQRTRTLSPSFSNSVSAFNNRGNSCAMMFLAASLTRGSRNGPMRSPWLNKRVRNAQPMQGLA